MSSRGMMPFMMAKMVSAGTDLILSLAVMFLRCEMTVVMLIFLPSNEAHPGPSTYGLLEKA